MCAIGYNLIFTPLLNRLINLKDQVSRKPLNELVFYDSACTKPLQIDDHPAFLQMKPALVACRCAPSSRNSQTTRAVVVFENADPSEDSDKDNEEEVSSQFWKRVDFYRAEDSKYYAADALGIWQAHFELVCEDLGVKGKYSVNEPACSKSSHAHY